MAGFCRAANFRALLKSPIAEQNLKEIRGLVERFYTTSVSAGRVDIGQSDVWADTEESDDSRTQISLDLKKLRRMPADIYEALCGYFTHSLGIDCVAHPPGDEAQFIVEHRIGNIAFGGSKSKSSGNRMVIFEGPNAKQHAGQIMDVLIYPGRNKPRLLFRIQPFAELGEDDKRYDPFRCHEDLGIRTCYAGRQTRPVIVSSKSIISHFASWKTEISGINEECVVVLSLDRVRELAFPTLPCRLTCSRADSITNGAKGRR